MLGSWARGLHRKIFGLFVRSRRRIIRGPVADSGGYANHRLSVALLAIFWAPKRRVAAKRMFAVGP